MKRKLLIAPFLALGLAAAPALAQATAPAPKEAAIALAHHGGIYDWRSAGDRTIYVEDRSHHWYKATLMSPAIDLPYAEAIGFDTGPADTFDHFSSVTIEGQHYAVQSLIRIDGPPTLRRPA